MTAKGVTCTDCRFCGVAKGWCYLKALQVAVNSVRNCKVYTKLQPGEKHHDED